VDYSPNRQHQSIGTDRLQKAIERNRAKQAQRVGGPNNQRPRDNFQEDLFGRERENFSTPPQRSLPRQPFSSEGSSRHSNSNSNGGQLAASSPARPMRRTIGLSSDEIGFTNNLRQAPNRVPGTIGYNTGRNQSAVSALGGSVGGSRTGATSNISSIKRSEGTIGVGRNDRVFEKSKERDREKSKSFWANIFIYAGWAFCFFLALRMSFAERGAWEYYRRHQVLDSRMELLNSVKMQNDTIKSEIELLQNDKNYQKKIIRDTLGFISDDEYLVLFPEEERETAQVESSLH